MRGSLRMGVNGMFQAAIGMGIPVHVVELSPLLSSPGVGGVAWLAVAAVFLLALHLVAKSSRRTIYRIEVDAAHGV